MRMVSIWDVKYKSATDPWTCAIVGDCRTVSPQYDILYSTVPGVEYDSFRGLVAQCLYFVGADFA